MRILCVNPSNGEERYFPADQLLVTRYPILGETSDKRIVNIVSRPYTNQDEYNRVQNMLDTYNRNGRDINTAADLEEFLQLCNEPI